MPLRVRNIVRCRKFALMCSFISVLFTMLSMLLRILLLSIIGFIMIIVAIITSLLFWRCPRCKKRLPMRINAKNANNDIDGFYICPHCNTEFSSYDIIN